MKDKIFTIPFIRGMSVSLPKECVNLRELDFDSSAVEKTINTTGVSIIRQSPPDKTISDYCINAAENLFDELNFDKSKVDGIVFATYTDDYISPGSGYIVQDRLGLSETCIVTDIKQACAGFVHGLFQAFLLIQSGYCNNVLLCAGDTLTKVVNPKSKSERMIFSDAGAVALISAGEDVTKTSFAFFNNGNGFRALYVPAGGFRIPAKAGLTDKEVIDESGNIRTLENLHMNGLEVMTFVVYAAPRAVKSVLAMSDYTKEDIDLFVFHQANKTIVKSLGRILKLPAEKVPIHIEEYGNTAATSIPLTWCLEKIQNKNFSNAVLCGYGNGLTCAATSLNLNKTYFCKPKEI
ncbi:MAG: ketoacyl-ACP synthase III [Selenomonadaceae bacterium]|nr:ketoacyl-ACP synthase III [Selenomonadaceae bacterium]